MFKLVKMFGTFILAVGLLVIMTPWAMVTTFMSIVFEYLNKIYAKLVDYMIKNGEGL